MKPVICSVNTLFARVVRRESTIQHPDPQTFFITASQGKRLVDPNVDFQSLHIAKPAPFFLKGIEHHDGHVSSLIAVWNERLVGVRLVPIVDCVGAGELKDGLNLVLHFTGELLAYFSTGHHLAAVGRHGCANL